LLAALGSALGCGLLPKGNTAATRPPLQDRTAASDLTRNRSNTNGVLAGQVIDIANQRKPGASLTVQPLDGGPAVSALTNEQGYFTINGLQQGKKYRIVARAKSGEVQSIGSAEATAPNVVVMIKLSESRATEVDGKPTAISGGVGGVHSSIAGADERASGRNPPGSSDRLGPMGEVNPPSVGPSAVNPRLGRPQAEQTTSTPPVPDRPEYVAQDKSGAVPTVPRDLLSIPGPGLEPGRTESPSASPAATSPFLDFPLQDLELRPTTLAAYRGKLTLVDVWNTACIPCIEAMPDLMRLHRTYGPRGLVVVGVAAREVGTPESVAALIRWRGGSKGVNYPLLFEQEGKSVLGLFNVQSFPTLILLDDQGREVWRGVGLTPSNKRQLEAELQKRLQ
jgi:thiol-disulfide isomerase/thioredoxin